MRKHFFLSHVLQGFEWYDTMTTTILSNVTFEGYKYKQYATNPSDWWYSQTPHAFRMLSHSDQFKPGEWLQQTAGKHAHSVQLFESAGEAGGMGRGA